MAVLSNETPHHDVTDATFERDVLERSDQVPVVVDLWAEWCGPCRTLGPILERLVGERAGKVALAKVDVDANPGISASFRVQSIPAVYAIRNRAVVDHFIGALPEAQVRAFLDRLAPPETEVDRLVAAGDEGSLRRAVELEPANPKAVVALAELLVSSGGSPGARDEALQLLARVPETAEVRRVAALARVGDVDQHPDVERQLDELLPKVKGDDEARQKFLDLLELLGPDDPRTAQYRKALTAQLF